MTTDTTAPERITIFRTHIGIPDEIYKELKAGRLRQGWGHPSLRLRDENGDQIPKWQWEKSYADYAKWGAPTPRRYGILARMLSMQPGEVVVMPKCPKRNQFSVACVNGTYQFGDELDNDIGHIIPVAPDSVRTFDYRASDDAYTVSSLFSRANHRSPVTFAYDSNHIQAALRLLNESQDCLQAKEKIELVQAALDDALKVAAETMRKEVASWNGKHFEAAVKQAFQNQNYTIVADYPTYDGKGGDVDIVVRPPSNNFSLFMPQEIGVQVKWKQGIDTNDIAAVNQLVKWQEGDAVQKFVISSADDFTDECKKKAEDEGITLIGGLDTMYFLMGLPNPIREGE